MMTKPYMSSWEPIFCPTCLSESRPRKLWTDRMTQNLVCEIHGKVMTQQYFYAVMWGQAPDAP